MKNKSIWKIKYISLSLITISLLYANNTNDYSNFVNIYGTWTKDSNSNSYSGVGITFQTDNLNALLEYSSKSYKLGAIFLKKSKYGLYGKLWLSYLDFKNYKTQYKTLNLNQLSYGLGIWYNYNNINIELWYINHKLNGAKLANTTAHTQYLELAYRIKNQLWQFDFLSTYTREEAYNKHKNNLTLNSSYYPTLNSKIEYQYNSNKVNKKDNYKINLGIKYSFGAKSSNISPYLSWSYNTSSHSAIKVVYEKNIADKKIYFRDKFEESIFTSSIKAKEIAPNEFNKKITYSYNEAPIAKNDIATVKEWGIYNINVLVNDEDPEGKALKVTQITNANWEFKIVNNQIQFKATKPWTFSCNYRVTDWTKSATAKLTVTVIAKPKPKPKPKPEPTPNHKPKANPDSATTNQDTAVTIDVLSNDTDQDWDTLTIKSVWNPNHWTAEIVGWQIKYTPNAWFSGEDSFEYTVTDGKWGESTARVKVTVNEVNHAPEAQNVTVDANDNNSASVDLTSYISDADWDNLTISIVSAENIWTSDLDWITTSVDWKKVNISVSWWTWEAKVIYKVSDWKWWNTQAEITFTHLDWE